MLCEFAVNVDAAGFKEDVVLRLLWTSEAGSFDRKSYRCVEGDSVLAGPVVRVPEVTWLFEAACVLLDAVAVGFLILAFGAFRIGSADGPVIEVAFNCADS